MNQKRKDLIRGLSVVAGAFMVHFSLGHFYTISNMATYIISYIYARVDSSITDREAVWLSALGLGCQGIGMPIGGLLAVKFGPTAVMILTLLTGSGSILLTYVTIQKTFIGVVFTVGIIFGLAMGIGYSVAIACAVSWFPDRRGLVVGIIVGGFGLGSLVFTPIQTAYINPHNINVNQTTRRFSDDELLDRIPYAFLVLGSILAALQLAGCILIRMKPKPKEEEEHDGVHDVSTDPKTKKLVSDSQQAHPAEVDVSTKKMFRHIDYYLLFTMMFLNCFPTSVLTSSLKIFGQTHITDDRFLSSIAAVTSLFNCGGRVAWGAIVDRFSFKIPICIQLSIWGVFLFTFPLMSYTSGVLLKVMFSIWACSLFFFLSGVFSMMPAATGAIFGPAHLAVNYGMVYLGFAFGSILSLMVTLFWKSTPEVFFSVSGCVCLLTLSLAIWLDDKKIPKRLSFMKWFSNHCLVYRVNPFSIETVDPEV
uniref:MFS domain-containing protein n=1 Tax=Trichobilharzia regenti TaxID=157069 RepID=A0AA85J598_TRIRE|nr:unnamed protein product [Trichobilharzia regenti]